MNTDKILAESIAKDYAPKSSSKIAALKKLDAKAKLPATIFGYTCGIVSALVFGTGMCLAMQVIGKGIAGIALGVAVGLVGLADCDAKELNFINEKYLHPYLSFIKDNRRVLATVLTQPRIFQSEKIFERLFKHIFDSVLERFSYPQDERRYVMMFYLNGLTAIVTQWLKDECKKSVEEIAEIIRYCIFGRADKWEAGLSDAP